MVNGASEQIGMGLRQSVVDHPANAGRADSGFVLVPPSDSGKRDWSAALDLVREASEAIRIRDERATEMEIEHRLDAERASEDIRTLQEQLDETELRLAETEARARTAEARAAEAEAWLAKMHDAIVGSFARVVAGDDNAEAELRAAFANGDLGNPA
ncbi:hypothetical protein [Aureimonas pseudogalii]|uniref:Uncharacterized protein n=1 Tax=Aureimonas pseudogalii TaxID=1744844 RepID=A0A7W6EGQ8_9HYPH|nr:hypothetical protein [Aureimonas pseudogalii]MBB3998475.1 hypothetical protein [Aureimonas pseudogalii]